MMRMGRHNLYLKAALEKGTKLTIEEAQQKAFQQISQIQNPQTVEIFGITQISKTLAEIVEEPDEDFKEVKKEVVDELI